MPVLDIRFSWSQRVRMHRYTIVLIWLNAGIGLALALIGFFASVSIENVTEPTDRNPSRLVPRVIGLHGLYVIVHNLVGVKLCHNYFRYAEGSGTNLRLFLWTLIGLVTSLVGCFMAGVCVSSRDHLIDEIRRSFTDGMGRYTSEPGWKRRIDKIQVGMRCCGVDSFEDWHKTYWLARELLVLDSPDILEYAKIDGRVTPPVVPWSCCQLDVKGPCYHDPLQLPNPDRESTYETLNTRGCLDGMKASVHGTLYSSALLTGLLFVLQLGVTVLSRLDYTAARNAVALGDRRGAAPGWIYGRLDFGNRRGPNLLQIDRKYSGRGDSMVDLKLLSWTNDE